MCWLCYCYKWLKPMLHAMCWLCYCYKWLKPMLYAMCWLCYCYNCFTNTVCVIDNNFVVDSSRGLSGPVILNEPTRWFVIASQPFNAPHSFPSSYIVLKAQTRTLDTWYQREHWITCTSSMLSDYLWRWNMGSWSGRASKRWRASNPVTNKFVFFENAWFRESV